MILGKDRRGDVTESRMETHSVVEYLDVFLDSCLCLDPSSETTVVDQLLLQRAPKTLYRRSSSAAESHHHALTEPYVSLSTHTALVIQP